MVFNSFNFLLLFLPITLLVYYFLQNNNWRNLVLVGASFVFYAWGNLLWAGILCVSAFTDYLVGKRLVASDESWKRRGFLALSVAINIGLLSFFKYWDWVVGELGFAGLKHNIGLPAGISFYTFQTLSYSIDIYRKKFRPTDDFLGYLSFVSFFPQLVAGPIERAADLLPQLQKFRKKVAPRIVEFGLFMVFWGLFKKIVLADNLGNLAFVARKNIMDPGVGFILALVFMFQVYCDFSAYSDIARGSAKFFGIRIRRNFLTPYFAKSPGDVFRRWHITLSNWIRDYVYLPLSDKNQGNIRVSFNLILTMFLVGLWHGAGKFFILWGLYYGVMLAFYRLVPLDKFLIRFLGKLGKFLAICLMFFIIIYSYILFWSKTGLEFSFINRSFWKIHYLITDFDALPTIFFELLYGAMIFILPVFLTDLVGFFYRREFVDLYKFINFPTKVLLYLIMFYGLVFLGFRGSYDFIYFQF